MTLEVELKLGPFTDLKADVIDKGKCTGCGSCVAVCPTQVIKFIDDIPTLQEVPGEIPEGEPPVGKCIECKLCYFVCPVTESLEPRMQELFGTEDVFGTYLNLYKAKTEVPEIAEVAQDGGIVSTILAFAFQKGLIDGAIVSEASEENPWVPKPKIITSYEELMKSAGTRYSLSPNIISLAQYREVVEELLAKHPVGEDWLRLAFVGTPCQAHGIRKMHNALEGADIRPANLVVLNIGLFCMENFDAKKLHQLILDKTGATIDQIRKMDIKKGALHIFPKDGGDAKTIPLEETTEAVRSGCHSCEDLTAWYADISVGSIGTPGGWSTVFVRTQKGKDIFEGAVRANMIKKESLTEKGESLLRRLTSKKQETGKKYKETHV
ncbi:Coenzyme F420 hydrogenase/dehydrogenase, beta subunit C-terminal domain [Candidatus Borrarchaeum sp.]|uniref:Coenzyme F420 hydrogenase/dehydrogenase, beta subunit C-terminal domain n=1 Tax=Candidatus Borrarchaeum sp. TaxID=2846742 RepID=UPI00257C02E4|nr:Coenzyme F420 hydrogenase/dehydrogenase, beta subunit C-terminal domain [Candidatus Borrarchaeum sp.]